MGNIERQLVELWERLRERRFADVAGASLTIQLPLREAFVNSLIASSIAEQGAPVRSVRVTFRGGNRVGVEVDPKQFFLPRARVELDIQDVVDCAKDHTLRLRVAPESFSTALLLQGANLFPLPPGVVFAQNQISLHLPTLLAQQDMGDLFPLLRYIIITGAQGLLLIRLYATVPLSQE